MQKEEQRALRNPRTGVALWTATGRRVQDSSGADDRRSSRRRSRDSRLSNSLFGRGDHHDHLRTWEALLTSGDAAIDVQTETTRGDDDGKLPQEHGSY